MKFLYVLLFCLLGACVQAGELGFSVGEPVGGCSAGGCAARTVTRSKAVERTRVIPEVRQKFANHRVVRARHRGRTAHRGVRRFRLFRRR